MSVPTLPLHPWRLAPIWDEDEQKVLQAYGQQCRAAALEEAAKLFEAKNQGWHSDADATSAELIRSLK